MTLDLPERTPAYHEDDASQIPALVLLQSLGYEYLSPEEARAARGGRESQVLLVDVLAEALRRINRVRYRGEEFAFTESAIAEAIRQLRDIDKGDGLLQTNAQIFDLLRLGISQEQTIQGDKKSFQFDFIDWKNPRNNSFHVTEEFSVTRGGADDTRRPDIILFVNGIPFAVIECKRLGLKDPIGQAISQQIGYQKDDQIPRLYHYAQLLFAVTVDQASFATVGTPAKFWSVWKERTWPEKEIEALANRPVPANVKSRMLSWRKFGRSERSYLEHIEDEGGRGVSEQDRTLWALCRPERLLEMIQRFTVFDAGERKVARYQQVRCVERAHAAILRRDANGKRDGGIVWHTQGSGKSLTMVMLADTILRDASITAPKIVLVTDRIDLDDQIYGNFKNCGAELVQATTGQHLLELLVDPRARIITTLIHKFQHAVDNRSARNEDRNIFVLVDESHRTHFGPLHTNMKRVLPNACLLGFTGTPIRKKDRNTIDQFGGFIDTYTIDEAVEDKAVVPLLYEGRHVPQSVDDKSIDRWFERTVEGLTKEQAADLKKKFSTANQLNRTEQKIKTIAFDISMHFSQNWQGTGFKAQLTADRKEDALLYKKYLDEFGLVSNEVLISPPDQREGNEEVDEIRDASQRPDVNDFWKRMMNRHGTEAQYQKQVIQKFKGSGEPEIIIVVDKLLTGFDCPRNTVLYITRSLEEHTLLQAIARVNRLYEGKDFGYIIDYYGVLKKLGEAIDLFGSFNGEYDANDLANSVRDIKQEIAQLPQHHTDLRQVFKSVKNAQDLEAMLTALTDADVRESFYSKLTRFARTLQVALSSAEYLDTADQKLIVRYKDELKYFVSLRAASQRRYAETIDFRQYQARIQKLLDTHVRSSEVEVVVQPVSIFDRDAFQREIDKLSSDRSKALTIANRTDKAIRERMDEDPAFYKRFSELLEQTIEDALQQRIDDATFLARVRELAQKVRDRGGDDLPRALDGKEVAKAYFGVLRDGLNAKDLDPNHLAVLAIAVDDTILKLRIVNWVQSPDQQNRMRTAIEDVLFEWAHARGLSLDFLVVDHLIESCIDIARVRLP